LKVPGLRSSFEMVAGIVHFGRMLDKIRLQAHGKLPETYYKNFGGGFDGICIRFLQIDYPALAKRVTPGGSDLEILGWCFQKGRKPSDEEIEIGNAFLSKREWRDDASEHLERSKREGGFGNRSDIQTYFDLPKAEET
jgi:uncharacterized protein DUF5069